MNIIRIHLWDFLLKNSIFLLCLLVQVKGLSQEPLYQWTKQFTPVSGFSGGGGFEFASVIGMDEDNDGNLVLLGYHDFNTIVLDPLSINGEAGDSLVEGGKAFIAKFTRNGNLIWHKTIEGTESQFSNIEGLSDLKLGSDGSVVFCGNFHGQVDFDPGETENFLTTWTSNGLKFVLKLDRDGNFVWVRTFSPDTSTSLYQGFKMNFNDIELDLDDNIYIAGSVYGRWDIDPDPADTLYIPDYHFGLDGYLLKLSSNGDYVWHQVFGTSGEHHPDNAYLIKRGLDNDLYFGCSYLDSIVINVAGQDVLLNHPPGVFADDLDYFMAKMDTSGQFEWVTRIVGNGGQWIREIEVDTNGEIYACGSFVGSVTMYPFVPGTYAYSPFNTTLQEYLPDAFVIKYTSTGVPIWGKVITSLYTDALYRIELDEDNVYFGGTTGDSVYVGNEFMGYLETLNISTYNNHRGTILQVSKEGETGWMKRFESSGNAALAEFIVSGNDIFTSGSFSYQADFDLSDNGYEYLYTDAPFKNHGFLHKMIFSEDTFNVSQYAIYPNPFEDLVNLYVKDFENTEVTVFDIQGRLLREIGLNGKITSIDLSENAAGVYVLVLKNGEKRESVRIVKQ
ncbi:MAG: T9SS type A sorting domain-containing protein [Flavobacteriales bacterium]|nr:T9SS type A sorting domain-containing protein [Flavobacteriales bacterium]